MVALWWRAGVTCLRTNCSARFWARPNRRFRRVRACAWELSRFGAENVRLAGYRLGCPVEFGQGRRLWLGIDRIWSSVLLLVGWRLSRPSHCKRSLYECLTFGAWPGDTSHIVGYSQLHFARRAKESYVVCVTQTRQPLAKIRCRVNLSENLSIGMCCLFSYARQIAMWIIAIPE